MEDPTWSWMPGWHKLIYMFARVSDLSDTPSGKQSISTAT